MVSFRVLSASYQKKPPFRFYLIHPQEPRDSFRALRIKRGEAVKKEYATC